MTQAAQEVFSQLYEDFLALQQEYMCVGPAHEEDVSTESEQEEKTNAKVEQAGNPFSFALQTYLEIIGYLKQQSYDSIIKLMAIAHKFKGYQQNLDAINAETWILPIQDTASYRLAMLLQQAIQSLIKIDLTEPAQGSSSYSIFKKADKTLSKFVVKNVMPQLKETLQSLELQMHQRIRVVKEQFKPVMQTLNQLQRQQRVSAREIKQPEIELLRIKQEIAHYPDEISTADGSIHPDTKSGQDPVKKSLQRSFTMTQALLEICRKKQSTRTGVVIGAKRQKRSISSPVRSPSPEMLVVREPSPRKATL